MIAGLIQLQSNVSIAGHVSVFRFIKRIKRSDGEQRDDGRRHNGDESIGEIGLLHWESCFHGSARLPVHHIDIFWDLTPFQCPIFASNVGIVPLSLWRREQRVRFTHELEFVRNTVNELAADTVRAVSEQQQGN